MNCPECKLRKDLHRNIINSKEKLLDISEWEKLIDSLDSLDSVKYTEINISGGEPILYRELMRLISYCKNKKYSVSLSSNGTLITEELSRNLIESGLDKINISLPSIDNNKYILLRSPKNINIDFISIIKTTIYNLKKFSRNRICIYINTHLQNNNYMYLKDIVLFCLETGVNSLVIDKLESTFDDSIYKLKMTNFDISICLDSLTKSNTIVFFDKLKFSNFLLGNIGPPPM
jgi:MoaA/NifB/PqqE/SkfB family radical SAM enzyme